MNKYIREMLMNDMQILEREKMMNDMQILERERERKDDE